MLLLIAPVSTNTCYLVEKRKPLIFAVKTSRNIRTGAKFVYVSQLDVLRNRSKAAGPIELVNNYVT